MFFWLFLFILSAFLEASVTPISLLLLLTISSSAILAGSFLLIIIFLSGLLKDILTLSPLGTTNIFLLWVSLVVILYSQKFNSKNPIFLLIFTFLVIVGKSVLGKEIFWPKILGETVLILPIFLFSRFLSRFFVREKELKLKVSGKG